MEKLLAFLHLSEEVPEMYPMYKDENERQIPPCGNCWCSDCKHCDCRSPKPKNID